MGTQKFDSKEPTGTTAGSGNGQTAAGGANGGKHDGAKRRNSDLHLANDPHPEGTRLGHYTMGKALGKGTFGKVKLATHTLTNEKVAIKILEKSRIKDKKDIERISREIKILKKVRHPNVIQLYEIIETESELFLIMEFCQNGELFDYIVSHQRLHEKAAVRMYQQLIAGIEYIHKSGICHRDLKPENLLLDFDKTLKIVDFGLSNMYNPDQNEQLKTACGSPCYAAPEMIAGKRYHGLKSDIWSSGVVLYAMVCGFLPFEDPKTSNLYKKILAGEFKIPKMLSEDCAHFVSKILCTDPDKRYGIDEIRQHPWFKQSKDRRPTGLFPGREAMPVNDKMYQQMLDEFNYDPDYSVKCIEANRHNQITATYHLLTKRALRQDKNFLERGGQDEQATANLVGSLDRGQRPTRMQQELEQQRKPNVAQPHHKRGQSTITGTGRAEQPISSIQQQAHLAALNIQDLSQAHKQKPAQANEINAEISAQKKYKLELQAEINKLRTKYNDYTKMSVTSNNDRASELRQSQPAPVQQNNANVASKHTSQSRASQSRAVESQHSATRQQNGNLSAMCKNAVDSYMMSQDSKSGAAANSVTVKQGTASSKNRAGSNQATAHVNQATVNATHKQQAGSNSNMKMAAMSITSPIKIQAVHNRPQLQTITHAGAGSGQGANRHDVYRDSRNQAQLVGVQGTNSNNTNKGGFQAARLSTQGGVVTDKLPKEERQRRSELKTHQPAQLVEANHKTMHKPNHSVMQQMAGGTHTNGFSVPSSNNGRNTTLSTADRGTPHHHVRYNSQLAQPNRSSIQDRMNMTIQHTHNLNNSQLAHQSYGGKAAKENLAGTNSALRPQKLMSNPGQVVPDKMLATQYRSTNTSGGQQSGPPSGYRGVDLNLNAIRNDRKSGKTSGRGMQQSHPASTHHSRHVSNRFSNTAGSSNPAPQLQTTTNANQTHYGGMAHMLKTNNLMSEASRDAPTSSNVQSKGSSAIKPVKYANAGGFDSAAIEKPHVVTSANNTRNWRNKSIDNTPEPQMSQQPKALVTGTMPDGITSDVQQYSYSVGKRAGSTAAGERHHQAIMVGSQGPGKLQNASHNQKAKLNATTDYSYSIGPTAGSSNHQRQGSMAAPRHAAASKFSDVKFNQTQTVDFNKTQGNIVTASTIAASGANGSGGMNRLHELIGQSGPARPDMYLNQSQKYPLSSSNGPGQSNVGGIHKKTTHSIDLGVRATQNMTQNFMAAKQQYATGSSHPQQQMMTLQARGPAQPYFHQSPPAGQKGKFTPAYPTTANKPSNQSQNNAAINLNISELYKQYTQKQYYPSTAGKDDPQMHATGGSSLQQYFQGVGSQNQQAQRSSTVGQQQKHRAISVTDNMQGGNSKHMNNSILSDHHMGGFAQNSTNMGAAGAQQFMPQQHQGHTHGRNLSQSSQQPNRKSYKMDPLSNMMQTSIPRHNGVHMPASAGISTSGGASSALGPAPVGLNGSLIMTTTSNNHGVMGVNQGGNAGAGGGPGQQMYHRGY